MALDYVDANLVQFRDAYLRGDLKLREEIKAEGPPQWPGKVKTAA